MGENTGISPLMTGLMVVGAVGLGWAAGRAHMASDVSSADSTFLDDNGIATIGFGGPRDASAE